MKVEARRRGHNSGSLVRLRNYFGRFWNKAGSSGRRFQLARSRVAAAAPVPRSSSLTKVSI